MAIWLRSNLPKSVDFIREMDECQVRRMRSCGWNVSPALFLTIEVNATSGVSAGVVRDYRHCVYYNVLSATRGTIENLTDEELKFLVDHEQSEIHDIQVDLAITDNPSPFTTIEKEEERHVPEMEMLRQKYGDAVDSAIQKIHDIARHYTFVPRWAAGFWIDYYVVENYEVFSKMSVPMTAEMKSEGQRKAYVAKLIRIGHEYRDEGFSKKCLELELTTYLRQKTSNPAL